GSPVRSAARSRVLARPRCQGRQSGCGNLWPRSSEQVCASSYSLWRIPLWRVWRIDHTHVRRIELLELRHLGIRKFEIIDVEILSQVLGRRSARDGANTHLHQITQRNLRRTLSVSLSNALKRVGTRNLAPRDRTICDD